MISLLGIDATTLGAPPGVLGVESDLWSQLIEPVGTFKRIGVPSSVGSATEETW